MAVEQRWLLTPNALFDDIGRYCRTQDSGSISNGGSLQVGHLRVMRLKTPSTNLEDLPVEVREQIDIGGSRPVYLDDHYEGIRRFAGDGWRTVWYNPARALAPARMPLQDGDIGLFDDLVALETLCQKPSLTRCLGWCEDWGIPDNIRRHTQTVAWGAYVLAVKMWHVGVTVDPILAHRGGLLHDLDKIKTLEQSRGHGQLGAEFIESQGYPRLASIVRGHVLHTILQPGAKDRCWETKLVYFMDKLVEGDRIVPLEIRLYALKERYPEYVTTMNRAESAIWALNDRICSILSIPNHKKLITMLVKLQNNQYRP